MRGESARERIDGGALGIARDRRAGRAGRALGADWASRDRELCARMGKAARERIATSFRIETTIDETLALYEELVAEARY